MAKMARSFSASSPGGGSPMLWQCYVRNLDWSVTQAALRTTAFVSGNVRGGELVDLRLCRSGQFHAGKMCSAFFGFYSEDAASRLSNSWNGMMIPSICTNNRSGTTTTALICKVVSPYDDAPAAVRHRYLPRQTFLHSEPAPQEPHDHLLLLLVLPLMMRKLLPAARQPT